ncbi:tetratricopeptide repeat protein [Alteromonas gracilis]
MTQQPFSRPGAVDLSALKRPATPAGAPAGGAAAPAGGSSYAVQVDDQNFQAVLEASMQAPVILAFYSPSRAPQSTQLADDLQTLSDELNGKFLLGRVDIDAAPAIAQAMQIPSVPLVALVAQGRPMPLFQDVVPLEELRSALASVFQQLATQGFTGQHQPRQAASSPDAEGDEEQIDPRYAPAQDALAEGDVDRAVAEYQKLVAGNPGDHEAAAGLAMAQLLQRTQGVDLNAARAAAAEAPDDIDAQIMVADLDLLGGHVEDSFRRLIDLIRRTADADRDRVRTHLVGLFGAVGNDDPRVLKGRRELASALF